MVLIYWRRAQASPSAIFPLPTAVYRISARITALSSQSPFATINLPLSWRSHAFLSNRAPPAFQVHIRPPSKVSASILLPFANRNLLQLLLVRPGGFVLNTSHHPSLSTIRPDASYHTSHAGVQRR